MIKKIKIKNNQYRKKHKIHILKNILYIKYYQVVNIKYNYVKICTKK